ncbi:methyltransferase family protein [Salsuginibacillus halophilus]|uniref:Methyltransferase family protein n=1 Tax=Salsuginibacillus halophilus TaxID=517424 RepID=A0A2P8H975_9BACI|nr:class I SAM-dependent methyltransferase [Salsuginibacillus halophilus]PSL42783.1 methyltransferase family protein [Salsuginibacillus halophilus]
MSHLFARCYDAFMFPLERSTFQAKRQETAGKATGHVLELGSGTGANFPFYKHADSVTAVEPDPAMRERSTKKGQRAASPVILADARAEELPFHNNSFDTVIATLVFCSIDDPHQAFQEIQRVAKPGARVYFFEHVRSHHPLIEGLQDALTPAWKRVFDGCRLNRPTDHLLKAAGFQNVQIDEAFEHVFVTIEGQIPES